MIVAEPDAAPEAGHPVRSLYDLSTAQLFCASLNYSVVLSTRTP